jgi:hypothetical protein
VSDVVVTHAWHPWNETGQSVQARLCALPLCGAIVVGDIAHMYDGANIQFLRVLLDPFRLGGKFRNVAPVLTNIVLGVWQNDYGKWFRTQRYCRLNEPDEECCKPHSEKSEEFHVGVFLDVYIFSKLNLKLFPRENQDRIDV